VIRALDSVLNQTEKPHEIIVIDDGSTDRTATVLAGYAPDIIRIRHPQNRGVSAARNMGIRKASGDWIALLDSDDEWKPEKLERNRLFHEQYSEFLIFQNEEIWVHREFAASKPSRARRPFVLFRNRETPCRISQIC
jgi:glycosyltransferase involved in cell wall biosynthesis